MDSNAGDAISELQTLLVKYRTNLALLLKGKCSHFLLRSEYMEVYYFSNELKAVEKKLYNVELQFQHPKWLQKKFHVNMSNQRSRDHLLKMHATFFKNILEFKSKLISHELAKQEFSVLYQLFCLHITLCDFQFTLDLGARLLKIVCNVQDMQLITKLLAEFGRLFCLLGKYQFGYEIINEMLDLKTDDVFMKSMLVRSLSAVELILERKEESLKHAKISLDLARETHDPNHIACAYGNIGLALEYMDRYNDAIEPYEKCLQIGENSGDYRVINNGLCNLGRAYQGLGEIQKAKEFFKKAINTPRPPKAYWGDTEEFRFSGDYLLAKVAIQENNLDDASEQLIGVIKRCEKLRKSIQDSPIKITFNDTQRKPFQYLQHVMLEQREEIGALLVAEKGRGRDFFDKIEGEFPTQIDSKEELLEMIKRRGIAVLFISVLQDIGKLCLWFISSKGKLLKQWSISYSNCEKMLIKLCVELIKTQGRHQIELKGTEVDELSTLIQKAIKIVKYDSAESGEIDLTTNSQSCKSSSLLGTTGENQIQKEISHISTTSINQDSLPKPESAQEPGPENECSLPDLIDQLSELILSPFQKELENVLDTSTTNENPRLLIIPQGKSFNIPFAALKLNQKPLCNRVTIIEAFSLNSFAYFTLEKERSTETNNFANALIVGNPSHKKNLPQAEEEAKRLAQILGVTALIKEKATKRAVMEKLPNAKIIHFACHGELNGNGLVLACDSNTSYEDFHLTNRDVEGIKLNADLVVLSACHTARGRINSEGVLGLARAFQVAGARSVVTALWAIPDAATKYFMEHFYDHLRFGYPVADAIRATQVKMQENENFNDVINWGSFKVIGANLRVM